MRIDTKDAAHGKWPGILQHFGIGAEYLRNINGPCPMCGGKDRFRFDDKGDGRYICNQCGAGDGFVMLEKITGRDFADLAREIDGIVGNIPATSTAGAPKDPAKARARIERIWKGARAPEIVAQYLNRRGLSFVPPALKGHKALEYFGEDGKMVDRFPAMVAMILGADGRAQSLHVTYLADVPIRKKMLPAVETIAAGAIRLFPPVEALALTEGIETAAAVHELTGLPVWACMNEGGLQSVVLPESVRKVAIYGDNDHNFVGQNAAYALAKRLHREGRKVAPPSFPPKAGHDWLDHLNAIKVPV